MAYDTYKKRVKVGAATPQNEPIPGRERDMIKNAAGGYTFKTGDWKRLERFLILGSESPTYYTTARTLTRENAQVVDRCLASDGLRVVNTILDVATNNRAPKPDPCLFALALAASFGVNLKEGEPGFAGALLVRQHALAQLTIVARTGTQLKLFNGFAEQFRGRGRALNRAIAHWFTSRSPRSFAMQTLKYGSRDGWTDRDLLRLTRPKLSGMHQDIAHYIVKGWPDVGSEPHPQNELRQLWAVEYLKKVTNINEAVNLIVDHKLTREMVQLAEGTTDATRWLKHNIIWHALLQDMPLMAMLRNLAAMTRSGVITPLSEAERTVRTVLQDQRRIVESALHPLFFLNALMGYNAQSPAPRLGRELTYKDSWITNKNIVADLEPCFYWAFPNVAPMGVNIAIGQDVSGSMGAGHVAGMFGMTPIVASAAMALVFARTEPNTLILGYDTNVREVPIGPRDRITDVTRNISRWNYGGTDSSALMRHCLDKKIPVDLFLIQTDNESWSGRIQPVQALDQYNKSMNRAARMAVISYTATGNTIADPNRDDMLDLAGFDTASLQVLYDFGRTRS